MFGLFKRKSPVFKKRTKELVSEQRTKEVGKVTFLVKNSSGEELTVVNYGFVADCDTSPGHDEHIDYRGRLVEVKEPYFYTRGYIVAKDIAKAKIEDLTRFGDTIVDDEKNPTRSISGPIVSAKILSIEAHEATYTHYSVRDIEVVK